MLTLAYLLTYLVAIEHFYIFYLETFAINSPKAKRIFNLDDAFICQPKVKVLFANQGLYNGFLGAGLILAHCLNQFAMVYFFLICVVIAAVFGAVSAKNKGILLKQGLPALMALMAYGASLF